MEERLYDDLSEANYTILEQMTVDLQGNFTVYQARKEGHENFDQIVTKAKGGLRKITNKVATLKTEKPHITEEEWADVISKTNDAIKWIDEQHEKLASTPKNEDMNFDSEALNKKLKDVSKLFKKVSSKKAPKPKKEKKEKKEDGESKAEDGEEKKDEEKKEGGEDSKSEGQSTEEGKQDL